MPSRDLYIETDADGSVMAVLSNDGEVLERRSYSASGQVTYMLPDGTIVPESPTGVDIGYRGQLMDTTTGLYENRGQWYSPTLGQNINAPLSRTPGMPQPSMERIPHKRPILVVACIYNRYCEKLVRDCNGRVIDVIPGFTKQVTGYGESTSIDEAMKLALKDAELKAADIQCSPGFDIKGPNFECRVVDYK